MNLSLRLAERRILLILVDLFIVNLSTYIGLWIHWSRNENIVERSLWLDRAFLLDQIAWFPLLSALWFLAAFLVGVYEPTRWQSMSSITSSLLLAATLVMFAYVAIFFFFAVPQPLPRGIVLYQGVSSLVLLGLWRALYRGLFERTSFARKVVIAGAGWAGQTIAQTIQQHAATYYQIVGFVDDDPEKQGKPIADRKRQTAIRPAPSAIGAPVLGASRDLVRLVKENQIREVIVAITQDISAPMFQAILECKEQGAQITMMSALYEQLTGQVPVEHVGDHWNVALPLDSAEADGFYPIAKRAFDVIGALVGLTLFLPMLPLIALAIYLDAPGPIFYRHERLGKGGKVFKLIKLRTMIPDAEADGRAQRALTHDPRVTRVGRLLRKVRLDEMPQLLNVLKGDMSAVGPRPERPEHLEELDRVIPFHRLRNAVKPGMAGWAVVNYDYIESVEDAKIRLQYDLYYIKHQSLWLDLLIVLRTMGHMVALKGR